MRFEWDDTKNQANVRKHGVSFDLAKTIFQGPVPVLTSLDERDDYGEDRCVSIGLAAGAVALVVVRTDRNGRVRIISARPARRRERRIYEERVFGSAYR
ncbi:MAG: BrnT family toxin [Gammaproteobacteria bacterium]|nr:BrnT family toxin [Gammaproteobacteria bacterium]MDE0272188.1 BrnT family toxin [Gammaproteobacteria bacterium]